MRYKRPGSTSDQSRYLLRCRALNVINCLGKDYLELTRKVHSPRLMTAGDSPSAEFPCCCRLPMLRSTMSLFWLWATIGLPLKASSDEVRVWDRAKLTCVDRWEVAHRGAKWVEAVGAGCAGQSSTRNYVLLSYRRCRRGEGGPTEDSVIFFVRYTEWSLMHKHIHMVRD